MKPGGKSGTSGNPTAEKIARIIFQLQDHSIDALNRHGAWIRKLPEYIMRQTHNPVLMRRQGFEAWFKKIQETVDMERTLEGVDPEKTNQFWRTVYEGLITGVHLKHEGADFSDDIAKVKEEIGVTVHNFDDLDQFNNIDDVAALSLALDMVVSIANIVPLISAAVGTSTKLASWRQSPWNNVLMKPRGPLVDKFERDTWEPWENVFNLITNDILKFAKDWRHK